MNFTIQKNILRFISKYVNMNFDKYIMLLIHEKDEKLAVKYFPNYYKMYEKISVICNKRSARYFQNSNVIFTDDNVKDSSKFYSINVNKTFECQLCGKKLLTLNSLKKHLLSHEPSDVETIHDRNGSRFKASAYKEIRNSPDIDSSNTVTNGKRLENNFSDNIKKLPKSELIEGRNSENQIESNVVKSLFNFELCDKRYSLASKLLKHLPCDNITTKDFRKNDNVSNVTKLMSGNSNLENQASLSCNQIEDRLKDSLNTGDRIIKNHKTDSDSIINVKTVTAKENSVNICKFSHEKLDSSSLINEHQLRQGIVNKNTNKVEENRNVVPSKSRSVDVKLLNRTVSKVCKISDKSLQCDICKAWFKYKWTLRTHMMRHIEENPFLCHICGKTFNNKSSIWFHIKHVHHGIKKHKCEFCGKKFPVRSSLEIHLRKHTGERPFMCDICGKTFPSSTALKIHNKSHSSKSCRNNKPTKKYFPLSDGTKKTHACDICGRCFRYPRDVRRHRSIHSTERPFLCPFCPLSFNVEQNCKRHVDRHGVKIEAAV